MKKTPNLTALALLGAIALLLVPAAASAAGVLFVKNNRVGVMTDNPSDDFEVKTDGARIKVVDTSAGATAKQVLQLVGNNGDPKALYTGPNGTWSLSPSGSNFLINLFGDADIEAKIKASGDLVISGSLTEGSSRTIKQDFAAVDGTVVLEKVLALPISEWSYIQSSPERHVGPMAEDFSDVFGLGADNRHIAPRDIAGVALAAIQGLHAKLEAKDGEIAALKQRLEALEAALLP